MTTPPSKEEIKRKADAAEARARGETAKDFLATSLTEGEVDAEIRRLAALPEGVYESSRKAALERLPEGFRGGVLDRLVKAERTKATKEQKDFLPHWKVAPWPESVNGAALLDELRNYFLRHAALPKHADVVLALWSLHTWVFDDCFDVTPYLVVSSPTRRCGKSLVLTILQWLCRRGKKNDSMSKAAIYRSVENERPTLVLDETGWVVDLKDERQGILCGGFERNGFVEVCEGDSANITVRRYSTFCPKAFGIIGRLTATLMDRSIEVAMQRKTKSDNVERLGRRDNADYARLRQRCLRWANDNREALATVAVKVPDGLNDRAFDIWEPLLVIAEHVGGNWPKLALEAAIALSGGDSIAEEERIELLADIKLVFEASGEDEVTTKTLVAALCEQEERPWATYNKGDPVSDRQVAKLLKQFPIVSEDVRPPGGKHAKGYKKVRFLDAFDRYLTPPNLASPGIGGAQACKRANTDETGTTGDFSVRAESDLHGCEKCEKPANDGGLHACTDKNPQTPNEACSDHQNGSNGTGAFRSDIEDAYAELRERGEFTVPADGSIPKFLDRSNEPRCDRCGLPGATECSYDGLALWLHSRCLRPWIDAYEAKRDGTVREPSA